MPLVLGVGVGASKRQWVWEPPTVVPPRAHGELTLLHSCGSAWLKGPHCSLTRGLSHPPFGQTAFHFVLRW